MSTVTSRMLDRREFLKNSYKDDDRLRENELTIIGPSQVADDLNEFYDRLSTIKDYHRKNSNIFHLTKDYNTHSHSLAPQ